MNKEYKALKPLNYKGKTIDKNVVLELEEQVANKLIEKKAVIEIKENENNLNIGVKKWEL